MAFTLRSIRRRTEADPVVLKTFLDFTKEFEKAVTQFTKVPDTSETVRAGVMFEKLGATYGRGSKWLNIVHVVLNRRKKELDE